MLKGHIPFAADSKSAIEQAQYAATELGHEWVDTEHLLVGLTQAQDGLAARILRSVGFTPDALRNKVKDADRPSLTTGEQQPRRAD
jgi:ATP-dependent Clp protease ATP-binding subunit ClpA